MKRREPNGRPPAAPTSPDARLIARACARLGMRRGELAKALGLKSGAVLSRANDVPLAEHHRVKLRAMLANSGEQAAP